MDVQQSDPREYRAIPADAAIERLRRNHAEVLDAVPEVTVAVTEMNQTTIERKGKHTPVGCCSWTTPPSS